MRLGVWCVLGVVVVGCPMQNPGGDVGADGAQRRWWMPAVRRPDAGAVETTTTINRLRTSVDTRVRLRVPS